MKTDEIQIGGTYLTKIGEELCRVVVVQRRIGTAFHREGRKHRDTFDIRREDGDRVLPKPRSAAALRPIPAPPEIIVNRYVAKDREHFDRVLNALIFSKGWSRLFDDERHAIMVKNSDSENVSRRVAFIRIAESETDA